MGSCGRPFPRGNAMDSRLSLEGCPWSIWKFYTRLSVQLAVNSNQHLRNMALDALDQSICAVLGSNQFQDRVQLGSLPDPQHVTVIFHTSTIHYI